VVYDCLVYTPIIQKEPLCDNSSSSIACSTGVIQIVSANYGRLSTDPSICVSGSITSSLSTALCYSDQTSSIGNLCNDKISCSYTASIFFFLVDPCTLTFKYLSVQYQCKSMITSPTTTTIASTTRTTTTTTTNQNLNQSNSITDIFPNQFLLFAALLYCVFNNF